MNWKFKINWKREDNSPKLKPGQVKEILISMCKKEFPEFNFLEYKNSCYTFENIRIVNDRNVYRYIHIIHSLQNQYFDCSVASIINKELLNSSSYNLGILNSHQNLLTLKNKTLKSTTVRNNYVHNGRLKTTTKIVEELVRDLTKFGKPFFQNQAEIIENSPLLKVGFHFISNLHIDKSKLRNQLNHELKYNKHLISSMKNQTYLQLKSELQNINEVPKDIRRTIPSLSLELLEYYIQQKIN